MSAKVPKVTLLPRSFHVRTRGGKRFLAARSRLTARTSAEARAARRAAFIAAERLSPAEAAYLPADFDPARPQEVSHA